MQSSSNVERINKKRHFDDYDKSYKKQNKKVLKKKNISNKRFMLETKYQNNF